MPRPHIICHMVTSIDGRGGLIGYYEKHVYRTAEAAPLYSMP